MSFSICFSVYVFKGMCLYSQDTEKGLFVFVTPWGEGPGERRLQLIQMGANPSYNMLKSFKQVDYHLTKQGVYWGGDSALRVLTEEYKMAGVLANIRLRPDGAWRSDI